MLSKKQADLRANALLKSAREERERAAMRSTRFLVFWFPALATCAASKRRSMLQAARARALSKKHVVILNSAVVLPAIGWLGALAVGWSGASSLLWIALCIVIGSQLVQHLQTRAELRAMPARRTSPIEGPEARG